MNDGKERRRRERFAMSQVIELSTSEGQFVKAEGINVSEGGLLCRADTAVPQGTLVKFTMSVPMGKSSMCVDCEGFILRCTEKEGRFDIVVDFTDQE
jgi:hypothetical protein